MFLQPEEFQKTGGQRREEVAEILPPEADATCSARPAGVAALMPELGPESNDWLGNPACSLTTAISSTARKPRGST
jgi:hypothetical protein